MKISCVYKITNTENDLVYIGSTCNFRKRRDYHRYKLRNNKHCNTPLQEVFNRVKMEGISFIILEESSPDKASLYLLEKKYFDLFGTDNLLNINIHPSSRKEMKLSEETIRKMKLSQKPMSDSHKNKLIESNKNRHWTQEMRERQAKNLINNFQSTSTRAKRKVSLSKPVSSHNKNGEFLMSFLSAIEAGLYYGINNGHISSCCNGKRKTA